MVDFYGNRDAAGRLPVSLDILPGEAVSSWLRALALRYEYSNFRSFLARPPLELPDLLTDVDQGLSAKAVDRLEYAALLDPGSLRQHFARGRYLMAARGRCAVCPVCLYDDVIAGRRPYRRLAWMRPTTLLCDEHYFPLIDLTILPQSDAALFDFLAPYLADDVRGKASLSPTLALYAQVDKWLGEKTDDYDLRHEIACLNKSALWQTKVCGAWEERRNVPGRHYIEMFGNWDPLGCKILFGVPAGSVCHRISAHQYASFCRVKNAGVRRQFVLGAVVFGHIRLKGIEPGIQTDPENFETDIWASSAGLTPQMRAAAETVMQSDFFAAVRRP